MQSFSGKPFPQRPFEIETLAQLMVARKCRSYLEIGARFGDSFHYLATRGLVGNDKCRVVAVDWPGQAWGNKDSEALLRKAADALNMRNSTHATVICGDSRAQETIDEAERLGPYDAVFIDGDHTAEGVLADWTNYGPMARKLVAFHDIDADSKPKKKAARFGVPALWRELKATRPHVEIISSERQMGIGILFVE